MVVKINLPQNFSPLKSAVDPVKMGFVGRRGYILSEVFLRLVIVAMFLCTENMKPFERVIQPEDWFLYKNPTQSIPWISTFKLYMVATCAPLLTILVFGSVFRSAQHDVLPALLSATLGLTLNGLITNCIKLGVGRPRPDFFYRCFPNGDPPEGQPSALHLHCTGDGDAIVEGRKSFPSGHSSFAFVSLGFCALYMCGKLHCFAPSGQGRSWRLCLALSPLLFAIMAAISRTCDYMHHWQDVAVGSLLGLSIACLSYYQYYPPLSSEAPHVPHMAQAKDQKELYSVGSSANLLPTDAVKHM